MKNRVNLSRVQKLKFVGHLSYTRQHLKGSIVAREQLGIDPTNDRLLSMCGKGKLSLGLAQFKSRQSTHILTLPILVQMNFKDEFSRQNYIPTFITIFCVQDRQHLSCYRFLVLLDLCFGQASCPQIYLVFFFFVKLINGFWLCCLGLLLLCC